MDQGSKFNLKCFIWSGILTLFPILWGTEQIKIAGIEVMSAYNKQTVNLSKHALLQVQNY
jgi:hypothetical protein